MHIRLRHSNTKLKATLINGPTEIEEPHTHVQALLDTELSAQRQYARCELQEIATYVPVVTAMPFPLLIVEWHDLNHRYIFKTTNGVAQWYHSGYYRPDRMIENYFFADEKLVSVTVSVFRILICMTALYGGLLHVDVPLSSIGHNHHFVNIWTQLDVDEEREENESFSRMMVCGSTKLVDLFHVLCGSKARLERFCVMPMKWEDGVLEKGLVYSYQRAVKSKATIEDLKWPKDVWLWPCRPYDEFLNTSGNWSQLEVHGFNTITYV